MAIYSYSRLGAFESCPRKYWYAYIGKPEIERVDTIEAFLGSRVHEALEECYERLMGGQRMSQQQLLAWYDSQWDRMWYEGVRVVNQTFTVEDYREAGRRSLKAYYKRYQPFDQSQTLILEARVFINLDAAGKYRLRGYIDRLAQREDGTYEIHDYKTARSLPTQTDADSDRQLALYQIGVQGMWNDVRQVELIWHYLRFDKEIRSRRTPEQLGATGQECIGVIDEIESRGREEAAFPTRRSRLCDWCEFREICPATRHQAAMSQLPLERFKTDAGVSLVDSWVRTREQRKVLEQQVLALKAEEEDLKQRVIAFATQQGLESVVGSSHSVEIAETLDVEYPKAGDKDRDAFDAALRQAGLWEELVTLNWQSFKAAWKDETAIPPEVREELRRFVHEATRLDARLKKGGIEE